LNRHGIAILLAMLAVVAFSVLTILPDWREADWTLPAGLALLLAAVGLWRAAERDRSAWQSAIDAMQAGIVAYDRHDLLLFTNAEFRRLYRLSDRDTVPGTPYERLLRMRVEAGQMPEAQGREQAWIEERIVQRRERGGGVTMRRMDDGRWRRITEQRLPDGSMLAFSVDVTELVQSQHALEAARHEIEDMHRLLHEAIEAMPAAVEVYDRTDRLVVFNQRMLAMYPHMIGHPTEGETFEALVRRALDQGAVPEARGREKEWLTDRLGERGRQTEPRLQRAPDGSWIHIYERPMPGGGLVTVRLIAAEFAIPREHSANSTAS
jgi:PAS domain-containing protein